MRETLCAIAVMVIVYTIGAGLEAARTAERLELILGSEVTTMDAFLLPSADGLVEKLEAAASMQIEQVETIKAERLAAEQDATKLAGAVP